MGSTAMIAGRAAPLHQYMRRKKRFCRFFFENSSAAASRQKLNQNA
jgi:hypothetical protein